MWVAKVQCMYSNINQILYDLTFSLQIIWDNISWLPWALKMTSIESAVSAAYSPTEWLIEIFPHEAYLVWALYVDQLNNASVDSDLAWTYLLAGAIAAYQKHRGGPVCIIATFTTSKYCFDRVVHQWSISIIRTTKISVTVALKKRSLN